MGLKRPFDDEFPELSFKHSRQGDNGYRVSAFGERFAYDDTPLKPNISGVFEDGFQKLQWGDVHADENETGSKLDNEVETSAPISWITTSSSEDDVGMGPTVHSSSSSEDFELDFRALASFEDIYSSYPTCSRSRSPRSPRKQVPVGPDHQANIPLCVGKISNDILDNYEQRLMGTCIIPIPDSSLSAPTDDDVGVGRRDCNCLDVGSLRCVRQHITEARGKLRDTLGQEVFSGLGFNDMGEALARKWSEEEEHVFHEVIYSSPTRNFWKNLSSMFSSRSKGEIVSYYFNVFMLRRRAAQNRSKLLDIDSDDDEWHEVRVGEDEDEDFTVDEVESPEDDDGNEDDTEDGAIGYGDSFDLSFESQGNATKSCAPDDGRMTVNHYETDDELGLIYFTEPCDSKTWDVRYPTDPVNYVDLLPTCNMIEEIFGRGTWNDRKTDDH